MSKIILGTIKFMEKDYSLNRELFENLAKKQEPHTLFIGCSDSRVVPTMITNTMPGELFVVRNIANIVPKYRISQEYVATTATIEYAILNLPIENIVVCGHSNCGGCEALYYDDKKLEQTPNVKKWLDMISHIKDMVQALDITDKTKISFMTERLNIINSLDNIMTYPSVKERVKSGALNLYGWHYIIEKGLIYSYNCRTKKFELFKENK